MGYNFGKITGPLQWVLGWRAGPNNGESPVFHVVAYYEIILYEGAPS